MELTLTEHASRRQGQRGFSTLSLQILRQFARERQVAGNRTLLFLGRKEATRAAREFKRLLQTLDKVTGSSMIIHNDQVVTVRKA